jgi:hypothetical protein
MDTPTHNVRVFLSSTFRDFAGERDLLVGKVFPELRRKCRERQVELVDVDLRWLGRRCSRTLRVRLPTRRNKKTAVSRRLFWRPVRD